MIDLCPTIAGVRLPFCLMNAAGALSASREELLALARSEAGAVVREGVSAFTRLKRECANSLELRSAAE